MVSEQKRQIVIGTRGSDLAVRQAELVKEAIVNSCPNITKDDIILKKIKTTGDRILNQSLSKIGGKGLFTKEIEEALLNKTVDLAVHSMKDLPAISPKGLKIEAILTREDPRDAFVSSKFRNISELPKGAVVATSSLRRQAMLLSLRPDLEIKPMRGNVQTRLKKLDAGEADALILATCGLKRLGLNSRIREAISIDEMLPAIGQGAIAVEIREDDQFLSSLLTAINDKTTEIAVNAERIFMLGVDGDCKTPMAAYVQIDRDDLQMYTAILHPLGIKSYYTKKSGKISQSHDIANSLVEENKRKAADILAYIKANG